MQAIQFPRAFVSAAKIASSFQLEDVGDPVVAKLGKCNGEWYHIRVNRHGEGSNPDFGVFTRMRLGRVKPSRSELDDTRIRSNGSSIALECFYFPSARFSVDN